MKNLEIAKKLLLSFCIVVSLTIAVGLTGIIGMRYINNASARMYEQYTRPLPYLSYSIEYLQETRYLLRDYIIATSLVDDPVSVAAVSDRMEERIKLINHYLDLFAPALTDPAAISMYNEARNIINTEYVPFLRSAHSYALARDPMSIYSELEAVSVTFGIALSNLSEILAVRIGLAADAANANSELFTVLMFVIIPLLAISVVCGIALALYISGSVGKPIKILSRYTTMMGREGDVEVSPQMRATLDFYGTRKDEIGDIFKAIDELIEYINECGGELEKVAAGDLTVDVITRSEKDSFSSQLKRMVESLHDMFVEITEASAQVSSDASQIAGGSHALAQGSTQQASTIEALSKATAEISQKTKDNAEMAYKASNLAKNIIESAEMGNRRMDEMVQAVNDIHVASQSISKVIKAIDDIAFQTNILALNASVEAARAGHHGRGFAVVANEVRTLAAKSAEAAKDTGALISNSMEKAEYGANIAKETAESLADIVKGINESSEIIQDIAEASEKQTLGISEIDTGIDEVAIVVTQNSAIAEQSAAASLQLSGRSDMLRSLIANFKLKDSGLDINALPAAH